MTRRSVEIAKALEKDILGGVLPVGELVNEVALAEQFGVSRTPVREALLSLASTGLVKLQPGRGAIVVGISLQQVFDCYEVLAGLLGLAAELCAQRMSSLEKAQILSIHEEMGRYLHDPALRDAYMRLDVQFHDLIVKGSGNAVLAHQVAMCTKTIAAVRHASMESHVSLDSAYAEHTQVVAAITAKDSEAARKAMAGHLQLRGDTASRLVAAWRHHTQNTDATV
ncbi:MAG: GntR family transcriptional regulator [Giesbergeria sp.]|uniref:GntR family transcriptional regulator n=1 Tax=Giesbergeria sp. TaxID=2818473 RepID=UPI0026079111|nr:GntR family transcriptional regulator [Giesbergeria sp.]MDD2610217.1 GntR family transcriptional regulator [Giesbergeria sp.]